MPSTSTTAPNDKTQATASVTLPEHISLNKWEDTGFEWSGIVASTDFPRLKAILASEHEQPQLQLEAKLYRRSNVLHLAFELTGDVWLSCQRCLQPVAVDLTDSYNIALLDDDSQESLIDDEQDYLLLDEIVTEQTPERLLPFKKLIEDEILLKTPLSPKHDDCEMVTSQVGDIPEEENENPFAALASLKGKL